MQSLDTVGQVRLRQSNIIKKDLKDQFTFLHDLYVYIYQYCNECTNPTKCKYSIYCICIPL